MANTRGGGVLAADACGDVGLQIAALAADTRRALSGLLPAEAAVDGPVDTTSAVQPGQFRRCLELVGADPGVDAVLAVTATTATSDLVADVCAARLPVPIAAAIMDQTEAVRLLPGPDQDSPAVPAYAYPESAARALGHAARYGTWRAIPPDNVPELVGLRQDRARELVESFLAGAPGGGWLPRHQAVELLACYGVPVLDGVTVPAKDGPGVKVSISVLEEQIFGPLVLLGTDGTAGAVPDRTARLTPLTGADADTLIRAVRAAPLLAAQPAGLASLRDMVLRVSQLPDHLPQIAELELRPVVVRPEGALAVDAQVRIQPVPSADAYLRRLR